MSQSCLSSRSSSRRAPSSGHWRLAGRSVERPNQLRLRSSHPSQLRFSVMAWTCRTLLDAAPRDAHQSPDGRGGALVCSARGKDEGRRVCYSSREDDGGLMGTNGSIQRMLLIAALVVPLPGQSPLKPCASMTEEGAIID